MKTIDFLRDEGGAVTVDWVVLTASVVGLGMATTVVVSGGVEDLSRDIDASLRGTGITSSFWALSDLMSFDFSGGDIGAWLGGQIVNKGGQLGELLAIGPNQVVGLVIDIPEGAEQAVLTFDLIAGDSLDNESATVTLNGQTVLIATDTHGTPTTFQIPQVDGTTVNATVEIGPSNLGGPGWDDSVSTVTITVDQPPSTLDFAVSSNANQHIGDEYWGIDNFDVQG